AGVTDRLVAVAQLAELGEGEKAAAELRALLERPLSVASATTTESRGAVGADIRREVDQLLGLVPALPVLRELSPRSLAAVLAVGEVVSSRIVAAACVDRRLQAIGVDARKTLVTDAEHTAAVPDLVRTEDRLRDRVAPALEAGQVVVLGGFIGATPNGLTTTLGRGGSDYSAAVFGACL